MTMTTEKETNQKKIPSMTVRRLFLYYRALLESKDTSVISSEELAEITGFSAAQIRKDLTYFGQFGTPGRGYNIDQLKQKLIQILGVDREWNVALVGAGNLGRALLTYQGFKQQGFKVSTVFDKDKEKVGKSYHGVLISDFAHAKEIIKSHDIRIAIIAVPAVAAQEVVDQLVEAGVSAILNFVPYRIKVPPHIKLLNIDMAAELGRLSYYLTNDVVLAKMPELKEDTL